MQVTIYSTTTCPYCRMLKDYLTQRGVAFTEKLVDMSDEARDEMMASSGGFLGVPFTVVVDQNGKKETILGFDKGKIDSLLGLS